MLAQVSILFLLYALVRFVFPLPVSLFAKLGIGAILVLVSLKFEFYKRLGGSFFMPDLPQWFILVMSWLYSAFIVLCLLLVIRDVVLLVCWGARLLGFSVHTPLAGGWCSFGIGLLSLVVATFGTWQALRVPDVVSMELTGVPPELKGLKIVQLSDLHISSLLNREWMAEVVRKTNELHPDLILITGDFLDGSPKRIAQELRPIQDLRATYGVFGVAGNHEYYSGFDSWMPVLADFGITMLNNQHVVLTVNGKPLVLAGLTDRAAENFGKEAPDIQKTLANAPKNAFRLLMAHQPRSARENSKYDIHLQLSGHTHGGLIAFIDKLIIAAYNDGFVSGWYPVNDMKLHVHPGTGLWGGFPLRLGVSSQISLIELK